jgi:hypothetical protein
LHELGHVAGFHVGGIDDEHIDAALEEDHLHTDDLLHPHDLMNAELTPGVRMLPSQVDLELLLAHLPIYGPAPSIGATPLPDEHCLAGEEEWIDALAREQL